MLENNKTIKISKRPSDSNVPKVKKIKITELPDESKTYAASGLKKSLHGAAYQTKLLMLVAQRCHDKNYSFRLATEFDEAEKFDDLVLWCKKNDSNEEIVNTLFLQAKHSQTKGTIKYNDLVAENTKNQFSLKKYFDSFQKIKQQQLSSDGNFYLFTNKNFKFDESCNYESLKKLSSFYFELINEKEILLDVSQGCHYRLVNCPNSNEKSLVSQLQDIFGEAKESDIEEFCQRLIFAVNQPSETELGKIIKKELKIKFKLNDVDFVANSFLVTIFDWFKEREGTYLSNKKINEFFKEIREKLAQLVVIGITTDYTRKLENYKIEFREDTLFKLIRGFLAHRLHSILKIVINETLLQVCSIKVNQILNKYSMANQIQGRMVFGQLSTLIRQSETVIRAFSNNSTELVVIECNKKPDNNVKSFYEDLSKVIQEDKRKFKKIIFISEENENESLANIGIPFNKFLFRKTKKEIKYSDLTPSSKERLLKRKVNFQGENIVLKELLSVESPTTQFLPLHDIIRGVPIKIDKPLPVSTGYDEAYYIDRTFDAFQKIDHSKIDDLVGGNKRFWLAKNSLQATWTKQTGTLNELKQKLISDPEMTVKIRMSYPLRKFDSFLTEMQRNETIIITDCAGTGKSTVITHLSKNIKRKFPNNWVIRIDLNSYTDLLESQIGIDINVEELFINQFLVLSSEFERILFKQFLREKRVILMFDGFDEITPDYEKIVMNIIKGLKKTGLKQLWVTAKTHEKSKLENKLGSQSCSLRPFSTSDQRNFLNKFWVHKLNPLTTSKKRKDKCTSKYKRINTFGKKLVKHMSELISNKEKHLLGIPLQLRLMAEIYENDLREFLNSSLQTPLFHENFNLIDLYDKFIERKFDIFLEEKRKTRLSILSVKEGRDRELEMFNEHHQCLALRVIFPEDAEYLIEKANLNADISENKILRMGIVVRITNNPEFLHRTFAEYYLTLFLVQHLHEDYIKKLLFEKILVETNKKFTVIRKFLHFNLAKKLKEENSFNFTTELVDKKEKQTYKKILKGTILENNIAILRYILSSINQTSAQDIINNIIPYSKETLLHVAAKQGSSEAVECLLQNGANVNSFDSRHETPLHKAINEDYENIVAILVRFDVNINSVDANLATPLHYAANNGNMNIIKILVINGAFINAKDDFQRTPLHYAARNGQTETVEYLLLNEAEINALNERKETPLHLAAEYGHTQTVEILLRNGADRNIFNDKNETAFQVALRKGHVNVTSLMSSELGSMNNQSLRNLFEMND